MAFKVLAAHKRHRSVRPGRQSKVKVRQISLALDFCLAKPGNTHGEESPGSLSIVGGFNPTPFKKYARQNGFIFPNF